MTGCSTTPLGDVVIPPEESTVALYVLLGTQEFPVDDMNALASIKADNPCSLVHEIVNLAENELQGRRGHQPTFEDIQSQEERHAREQRELEKAQKQRESGKEEKDEGNSALCKYGNSLVAMLNTLDVADTPMGKATQLLHEALPHRIASKLVSMLILMDKEVRTLHMVTQEMQKIVSTFSAWEFYASLNTRVFVEDQWDYRKLAPEVAKEIASLIGDIFAYANLSKSVDNHRKTICLDDINW